MNGTELLIVVAFTLVGFFYGMMTSQLIEINASLAELDREYSED